jgi:hypothetical protein
MSDTWDGRPQHPDRDGWHWTQEGSSICPEQWRASKQVWRTFDQREFISPEKVQHWHYLGPCLTPTEVAAQVAAAYKRGQEDMRERAAVAARFVPIPEDASAVEAHGRMTAAMQAGLAILDLPIKEAPHE